MNKNILAIEELENIFDSFSKDEGKSCNVNITLLCAYRESKRAKQSRINFSEVIRDNDIQVIAETFRRLNIKEFTISVTSSNLFKNMADFKQIGILFEDVVYINNCSADREIPAILMKVM